MVRVLCAAGLVMLAVFMLSPHGTHPGISPIVAGPRTAVTWPLPYRVPAPQVNGKLELTALDLVNRERAAAGLAPLMPHATIRSAARAHGIELFTFGYLSHRSRDGRWPDERVRSLGVRARVVGENLAYAQDVRSAHDALIASAPHRENILSPRYTLFGIGVIDGGAFGVIVVQDFSDYR